MVPFPLELQMSDPHAQFAPSDEATPSTNLPLMSRREFARLAGLAAVAAACSSDSGDPVAPAGNGVTITGNVMTVPLAQNPTLNQTDGMILVRSASALVIRISATEYRALTSICTHQQCTVSSFVGGVLRCPCHGSRYSSSGAVVQGPATQSLRVFPTSFDAGSGIITATLS